MNITKKIANKFVQAVTEGLLEMGAIRQPQDHIRTDVIEFKLDTIVGNLNITLRKDQDHLFMVFARFDNVSKAKHKFDCNQYSGKYNFNHVFNGDIDQAIEFALMHFECTLPKELA